MLFDELERNDLSTATYPYDRDAYWSARQEPERADEGSLAMVTLAEIVTIHGSDYLREFGPRMLPSHRRALSDIAGCRTETMGGHVDECEDCGHQYYVYHSCKNRNCPKCHGSETGLWLDKRETELLPVRYFHLGRRNRCRA